MTRPTTLLTIAFALFCLFTYAPDSADYLMYERAAQRVANADTVNLYGMHHPHPPKFHYSYFFALCFVPLAKMGTILGQLLYFTLFAFCLVFVIRGSCSLVREIGPPLGARQTILSEVLGLLPLVYPALRSFDEGNIGLLIAAMLLASFLLEPRRPILAGALLGAAIAFKIYPAILLGYFVWAHRHKAAMASLAFAAGFYLLVPALFEGPPMAIKLIGMQAIALSEFGSHWSLAHPEHQNISGLILRVLPEGTSQTPFYALALTLGLLAPVLLLAPSFSRAKSRAEQVRSFILIFALIPLIVPTSWADMGIFFAPAIFLVAKEAIGGNLACRYGLAVFLLTRIYTNWVRNLSIPFLGGVALVAVLVAISKRPSASALRARSR